MQRHLRAHDVGLEEGKGIVQGARHMGFSREMYYHISVGDQVLNKIGVPDIAMAEAEVRVVPEALWEVIE